jgi:transposase-like protein
MSEEMLSCPSCDSEQVAKNGFIYNGKQNFLCKSCGRQIVLNPKNKVIEQETFRLDRQATAGKTTSGWHC